MLMRHNARIAKVPHHVARSRRGENFASLRPDRLAIVCARFARLPASQLLYEIRCTCAGSTQLPSANLTKTLSANRRLYHLSLTDGRSHHASD
jgi:hypothetical protein